MQLNDLNVLAAFLAVAEERSFTRVALRLGLSRSALSHAVRGLEERIGVRLLARTTRSVAPTDAGEQLIARLRPALGDVESVLDQIVGLRGRPAGPVRLVAPRVAARMVLAPKLEAFTRQYPDVVLDITTDDSPLDLVAGRFDAGVHLGEFIARHDCRQGVGRPARRDCGGAPVLPVPPQARIALWMRRLTGQRPRCSDVRSSFFQRESRGRANRRQPRAMSN